jgi:hypothetical protein
MMGVRPFSDMGMLLVDKAIQARMGLAGISLSHRRTASRRKPAQHHVSTRSAELRSEQLRQDAPAMNLSLGVHRTHTPL